MTPEAHTKTQEERMPEVGVAEILAPYRALISETPALLSLLYDIDMLPEQTVTVLGATRLARLCEAWKAGAPDAWHHDRAVEKLTDELALSRAETRTLRNQCVAQADEIERLRAGIQAFLDGDFEPKVKKIEKCPHGQYGYETCEACIEKHFQKLLASRAGDG